MSSSLQCPVLLIAAPASGQGKTTITAGLARLLTRNGKCVRVFKCGPDFLDPYWHALASGSAVHNLDLWLNGEEDIRCRLYEAAQSADVILIEGVMGLFDGLPSAADLAVLLGIPVLTVIDASAMAGTFGAITHGLRYYKSKLLWAGVLANLVASVGHAKMLQDSVVKDTEEASLVDSGWLGALHRSEKCSLPERYLGLTVASELPDAESRLDAIADLLASEPIGQLTDTEWQRWSVDIPMPKVESKVQFLAGKTVAVARDTAFCFIYPSNLDTLRDLGAELVFFSPVYGEPVPLCDALWLPGGYPELHAQAISDAHELRASIQEHLNADKPIWAECGGMMVLFDELILVDGAKVPMWGFIPGQVQMQKRLVALGPQQWLTKDGQLRGHTFHHSLTESALKPQALTEPQSAFGKPEAIYSYRSLQASYFHAWFASNPKATASLFCKEV